VSHIYGVINLEKREIKEVKVKKEGVIEYIIMGILMIVLFPLIIPGIILVITDKNKCKHWRECPLYRKSDSVCNKDQGMYYDYDRPGGCYYNIEQRKEELKQQGKRLRRLR
jgi:hypothetical protein